jgi:hypothetical protein
VKTLLNISSTSDPAPILFSFSTHVKQCAFDERMESGLKVRKMGFNVQPVSRNKTFFRMLNVTKRSRATRDEEKGANKRQRDQMEFIPLAFHRRRREAGSTHDGWDEDEAKVFQLPTDQGNDFPPPHTSF